MMGHSATFPFPARLKTSLQFDPVLLTIALTLLFGGLVILASASRTVADSTTGDPFYYLQRQLIAAVIGAVSGFVCLLIPMQVWRTLGPLMLFAGLALLLQPSLSFVWDVLFFARPVSTTEVVGAVIALLAIYVGARPTSDQA